jgi:beta-phosphoglucomutase-like phosphatase (HAD superfamily)
MSTPPHLCVVVEDSPFGAVGARAAGMSVLGYAPEDSGERLRHEGAKTFESMAELPALLALHRRRREQARHRSARYCAKMAA